MSYCLHLICHCINAIFRMVLQSDLYVQGPGGAVAGAGAAGALNASASFAAASAVVGIRAATSRSVRAGSVSAAGAREHDASIRVRGGAGAHQSIGTPVTSVTQYEEASMEEAHLSEDVINMMATKCADNFLDVPLVVMKEELSKEGLVLTADREAALLKDINTRKEAILAGREPSFRQYDSFYVLLIELLVLLY